MLHLAGPEPEGLTIGPFGDAPNNSSAGASGSAERRCLFLGAESSGVVYVFDISDPARPLFQSVARPPQPDAADEGTRLTTPEGLTYARCVYMSVARGGLGFAGPIMGLGWVGVWSAGGWLDRHGSQEVQGYTSRHTPV